LAVFILINFIGLINAINYLINTDIQNIKNLAEFLLKKILLLFSAFTVMYFTIKNREIGQWLAAAFVAGIIIWFAMHELNSIPGEFKRPLFKHKNPEMAALGSISFSASFFAVLLLLLVNIIFSKSAIAHFRKSGEENV
jgi:hypothetical protein